METPDRRFTVKDGVLVLNARDKDNKTAKENPKDLTTVREFNKDFVLKFDFKAANEATAHILIRNSVVHVADFVRRQDPQRPAKGFKTDDWNSVEINVKLLTHAKGRVLTEADNLVATCVNGKASAKLNGEDIDPNGITMLVYVYSKCNDVAYWTQPHAVSRGVVGIRPGSGKIEFRNIRFKELP
jgi:hypothetical protein